jgi:hypothetical protein
MSEFSPPEPLLVIVGAPVAAEVSFPLPSLVGPQGPAGESGTGGDFVLLKATSLSRTATPVLSATGDAYFVTHVIIAEGNAIDYTSLVVRLVRSGTGDTTRNITFERSTTLPLMAVLDFPLLVSSTQTLTLSLPSCTPNDVFPTFTAYIQGFKA